MLWTIALILTFFWLFGWININMMGGWFIHALLVSVIQGRRAERPFGNQKDRLSRSGEI